MIKKRNIALGFYQQSSTAQGVLDELKAASFTAYATIVRKSDDSILIDRFIPFKTLAVPFIGFLAIVFLIFLNYFNEIDISKNGLILVILAIIAITGMYTLWRFSKIINNSVINKFKNRVISNEILVIVAVEDTDIREALTILRHVKSGHPVTFLLRDAMVQKSNVEVPEELMTPDMQREEAYKLSSTLEQTTVNNADGYKLIKRFKKSSKMLKFLRDDIVDAEFIDQTIPSSAEWLLDNMYVLEGVIEDVRLNLPRNYSKKLPKITKGPFQGLPRVYALATELIKNSLGSLNRENIINFLEGYQVNHPLTIGELWAFPLMLRIRLIEWVESLGIHVDNRMREGEIASFWGNRLLNAAHHDINLLPTLLRDLSRDQTNFTGHFAEVLLDHLFDEESILPLVRNFLEDRFNMPMNDILHQEHLEETSEQVVFSNLIKSVITLSQLSWPDIFEVVSPVDAVLREDPTGIYSQMDFVTRNRYRETIESISRRIFKNEVDIARITVALSHTGKTIYEQHVGYYLIDNGRDTLERDVGYTAPFFQSINRWILRNSTLVYLGGISLIILLLESFLYLGLSKTELEFSKIALFLILALIPISELSLQFFNLILALIIPTTLRPKMLFTEGIPEEFKTLVIVPMLLNNKDSIQEDIDRLEIRFLANTDPILSFGLFSDFTDAKDMHMETDNALLDVAIKGLQALEKKYGPNKFFLFHRQRTFSKSENAFIGWERKRGKLEYLNRFLSGEILPENIVYMGNKEALAGIRFIITLDSDTQLPKDQAEALIEVLAHPLNRPFLSADKKKLERGYTIIQPRIGTDFVEAKTSWFSKLFSESTVVDPYTQAISNIYQDLTAESSYHGKGIYDLKAFHEILSGHFPIEHLLSHDLIEGAYSRVGFASNICLIDTPPKDYLTWFKRHHRWMRGDWQIIDWLFSTVPTFKNKNEPNLLSLMNRFKIFDNLRRALLPVSLIFLLLADWFISKSPSILTGLALFVLLLPSISFCITKLFTRSTYTFKSFLNEFKALSLRCLISTSLLPFEALYSLDALMRVVYRRLFSKRNLLQWTAYAAAHNNIKAHNKFLSQLTGVSFLGLLIVLLVAYFNIYDLVLALPFCLLWIAAPYIVHFVDRPLEEKVDKSLSEFDKLFLRKIGRKTWRFFDELVNAGTHWLPPDNYQTALNIEVASRTSPTNIGFWLTSVMNAHDFKYITTDIYINKVNATIQELKKLERYEGHFYNWYNTQTAEPLYPRYVSTVDSGNFLACLWTMKSALDEMITSSIIPENALVGVRDTIEILKETKDFSKIEEILNLINLKSYNLIQFISTVKDALKATNTLTRTLTLEYDELYWLKQIEEQLMGWDSIISRYFTWAEILNFLPIERLALIDPQSHLWKEKALGLKISMEMLSKEQLMPYLDPLIQAASKDYLPEDIKTWGKKLHESVSSAQWFAGEKLANVTDSIRDMQQFSDEMDLKFLYNNNRKLFAIGYNVDAKRIDTSHYDLLASEARISSLVAIAKEDVPLEHWWALGRSYSVVRGQTVLLSWGGTMFEYLMPLIFNKYHSDSLIGQGCNSAVICQKEYGKLRGLPWGISESAFSAIDSHKIYQYKSFGVPGLGLKRGLEEDLVVSPYSTLLALSIDANSAIKNLKRMSDKNLNLMGSYGFHEAMDFTRQRNQGGDRGVIVYTYMAHHQGMGFAAISNLLNNEAIINRFNKDPRINGISSLLYERIPSSPPIKVPPKKRENTLRRLVPFSKIPIIGVVETTQSITPKINLLSNEKYSLMISNTGGGYSRYGNIEIYRFRADTTQDSWGSFYYIKDIDSKDVWSAAYQPTQTSGKEYTVNFKGDKTEFIRKDYQIETLTEVVVSPEDNAEIRLITLINHSNRTRQLELTSYLELSLAPHLTDRAHPAFNKLFIETEKVPQSAALLGFRRLRSPEDLPIFAVHILATSKSLICDLQYETNRDKFIGRGNSLKHPFAMTSKLSNTTGTVLDPIFSLRSVISIEPGQRVQFSFITAVADSRVEAVSLIEKYKHFEASHRALELAWNYSQLELRYLRIQQEEVQLFQKLASRLIYPHIQFRSVENRLLKNRLGQSGLWTLGISGDLPIIVVTVGDMYDVDLVKQLLIAHAFWNLRGLKADLVILNEQITEYLQPLNEQIQAQINAHSYRNPMDQSGGVFLKNRDHIPEDILNLLLSCAHVVLVASRGSLYQQLVSPKSKVIYPQKLIINEKIREEASLPLPFLELPYFNGLGGYTQDGRSYVIYLGPNSNTPAPWINVIANPNFGTIVTESGMGCTWYGNSQTNRLTPWSNDPVLNPISDTIYIRDEETGVVWTPTAGPIRELDAYRISHSQGFSQFEHNSHGIAQKLLVFVSINDEGGLPLRIQRLTLSNHSTKIRHLSLTTYTEWVLGGNREDTEMHIITEWDATNQALFAYNRYNSDFGNYVAFVYSTMPINSYTGDRTEFIGRNQTTSNPAALLRKALSGHTGAALDPCAALQVLVEIKQGGVREVDFIMGYAKDVETARQLILQYQTKEKIDHLFTETKNYWDKTLETIQVEVPDMVTNFAMNRWLIYQALSCRFFGRAAFYQSSGAYGFRDQLQDTMALLYSNPHIARDYILKAASRQFLEGDVQHWWHAQSGAGVRTRCSDDLLWLPFVTAQYIRVTGDVTILQEKVPFLEADILTENQEEVYQVPKVSNESESLMEHCRRAVKKGITEGPHGLPLIGTCDWNDGMSLVGIHRKGESVWLAWFLIHVLHDFADLLVYDGKTKEDGAEYIEKAKNLAKVVESEAWDGSWYRRAYFDDGTPLGSKENTEAFIDSLPQSWAVISGLGNKERIATALESADKHLVDEEHNVVLLLTPPFDKTPLNPGYIKGYPPGVRENGGQYTHAATWFAMAYARTGNGNRAVDLLKMLSPTSHTSTDLANALYKVEPYVISADIYDLQGQVGRGGWTWYTGAAAWVYRVWLEEVLGFKLRDNKLFIDCAIPKEWDQFKIQYRYKTSHYDITVTNPHQLSKGTPSITLDGVLLTTAEIPLLDDGAKHLVSIVLLPLE